MRNDLDREQDDLNRQVDELNDRISTANAQGYGWPSNGEVGFLKAGRERFDRGVFEFNERVERYTADQTQFNRHVHRYNLMIAYPDGLDEESAIRARPPASRYASPN